jgi:enediyne biosynthesis protein E4
VGASAVRLLLALALALPLASCRPRAAPAPPVDAAREAPFVDITAAAGIRFRHVTGGTPPLNILETAGAGGAMFDADGDGLLDLFLVNGRYRDGRPEAQQPHHALYRNNGAAGAGPVRFTDVTARAGVGGHGYGMGCAVADVDGDGHLDLYVTQYGANVLYHNNGDGTFTDITRRAGVAAGGWSTSAAFADYDGDGYLDLYVTRYLVFTPQAQQLCRVEGVEVACPPRYYQGQSGILYHNNGDGTFRDVSRAAGVLHPDGKGLGCLWWDYDDDGRPDLYLANDGVANNLYHNDGGGHFTDVALTSGTAYGPTGSAEASMGVDAGDYDRDGRLDLFVGNFQNETDALYHNDGHDRFTYATAAAGLAEASLPMLTFGVGFLDYDNDGWPDLFAANGHVQDAIARIDPLCQFPQPRQLFRNAGGGRGGGPVRFVDVSAAAGPALTEPAVGRGAAFGDIDNDGAVDILVTNNGGRPMLLRNEVGTRRHWLSLRLVGRAPNRDAVGARVRLRASGALQVREVRAGSSYASSSDFRLFFGLGDRTAAEEIEVRWPDGRRTLLRGVAGDRQVIVREEDLVGSALPRRHGDTEKDTRREAE